MTESIRAAFAARFGEANAAAIESAATEHKNGVHDNPGSDPFKWALLIAIGSECITRFAGSHEITADPDEVKAWAYENADLASHDCDCDYLALMCGMYEGWVKVETPAEVTR
jgi:hypothetical protein